MHFCGGLDLTEKPNWPESELIRSRPRSRTYDSKIKSFRLLDGRIAKVAGGLLKPRTTLNAVLTVVDVLVDPHTHTNG